MLKKYQVRKYTITTTSYFVIYLGSVGNSCRHAFAWKEQSSGKFGKFEYLYSVILLSDRGGRCDGFPHFRERRRS